MDAVRWEQAKRVFEAALEKSAAERDAFVSAACCGDVELLDEVNNLLSGDGHVNSFLDDQAVAMLGEDAFNPEHSLYAGDVLAGRFEIIRLLGEGGMGRVYEALDKELEERIALKAIRPEIASHPGVLLRFKQEVQLTRRITHPNICRTFDLEKHRPQDCPTGRLKREVSFLTMELLKGETLADLLIRKKFLAPDQALPLVTQMASALASAHDAGIVHRDFKPSNIILVETERGVRAVVTDFGLAQAVLPNGPIWTSNQKRSLTASGRLLGTLAYMSPEQLERGEVTPSSDIYGLGLVMYEMLSGERPFADPIPFVEAVKRVRETAPLLSAKVPNLDENWETVVLRCLATNPEVRFSNPLQVVQAITDARATPRPDLSISLEEHSSIRKSINPTFWIASAVLISVMALFGIFLRYYGEKGDSRISPGSTVLLTDVHNNTGDPRFSLVTDLIRQQLSQSRHFNLMDHRQIQDVLPQMTRPANTELDPPVAREVALRTGASRVVFGSLSRVGDSYVLDVDIERPDNNPRRPRAQWENHWTCNTISDDSTTEIPRGFLSIIRDASDWIRSRVGESASDIAKFDLPPQDVTTDSWEALSDFADAQKLSAATKRDDALVELRNAIKVDPHFALAHMRIGDLLVSMNQYEAGYSAYKVALAEEHQRRLTLRERDRLEGIYYLDIEAFEKAEAAFKNYTVDFPNDYLSWFYRAYPLMMLDRTPEAISYLKKAEAIDPTRISAPAHLARFDLVLSNFDDASRWIQHLRSANHPDDANVIAGQLAFLEDHYDEALDNFVNLRRSNDALYRTFSYSLQAHLLAELGKYGEAITIINQGIEDDLASGDSSHRADKLLDRAYIALKRQQYDACSQDVSLALQLDRSFQRSITASALLGRAILESDGNPRLRQKLVVQIRDANERLPKGEFPPISIIAHARLLGEVYLAEGKWKDALKKFGSASDLEPPATDREYLGRALRFAALHTENPMDASKFRNQALAAYHRSVFGAGRVWQWPLDYSPGYTSDSFLSYASLSFELRTSDPNIEAELQRYAQRRSHADAELEDVKKAKMLLEEVRGKKVTLHN